MKSEISIAPVKFTPKSITITVETKEEMEALYELAMLDESIPDLVYKVFPGSEFKEKRKAVKRFLNFIYAFSNPTANRRQLK
jgi:hypothetical protein